MFSSFLVLLTWEWMFGEQVLPYALSYACLKSVNYALFFWIPFYLTVSLQMGNSQAGTFSVRATAWVWWTGRWVMQAEADGMLALLSLCCIDRCCTMWARSLAGL